MTRRLSFNQTTPQHYHPKWLETLLFEILAVV
jgi:hypothetical protein